MKKITLLLLIFIINYWQAKSQVFPEDFEGSFPPTGWTINNNGVGLGSEWITSTEAFSGTKAVVIPFEVIGGSNSQDWLITPQFTPTVTANVLTFYQKQSDVDDYFSTYTIRVSTNTVALGDFVILNTQAEGTFGDTYVLHSVDLSAYNGMPIYLAFVSEQDDGDSWFVDTVNLEDPNALAPNCAISPLPTNTETAVAVLAGEVTLNWNAPATGDAPSSYEVYFGTNSGSLSQVAEVAGTSYKVTGLSYSTLYYWRVVPKNFNGSASSCLEWSFTTGVSSGVPANDDCANATFIGGAPYENTQDASLATNNSGNIVVSGCGLGMNDGVWYTFMSVNGGTATVDITEVSGMFDVEVAVYSGSCGIFICEGFSDLGFTGDDESVVVPIDPATQYWVNVGHNNASTDQPEGAFKISLTLSSGATLSVEKNEQVALNADLFPNPTRNLLNISHRDRIDAVKMYNLLGQEVYREYPGKTKTKIDMSNLPNGIYVVDVFVEGKRGSYKVIKQ